MSGSDISRDEIIDQAADWAVRLDDGAQLSEAEQADFLAWLKTSPQHVEEFLRVSSMFEDLSFLDLAEETEPAGKIIPLNKAQDRHRPLWRPVMIGALAACAAIAVGLVSVRMVGPGEPAGVERQIAQTSIGESRTVHLSDGTQVILNTGSSAEFVLTETARTAELKEGEAYFSVTSDAARPFYLVAGDTMIEVVGTAFSTRLTETGIQLQVSEGVVLFGQAGPALPPLEDLALQPVRPEGAVRVSAGEAAFWRGGSRHPEMEIIDPSGIAPWRENRLVFVNTPFSQVVAEFNRYNQTQIRLNDAEIGQELLTVEFATDDLDGFIRFIEITRPNLQISRRGDEIQIRQK